MFCPNDKALLKPVNGVPTCPKCGYTKKGPAVSNIIHGAQVEDVKKSVIDHGDKKLDLLPITDEYACEKCGNGKAYYFMRQTRSADEATTRFLECTRCGHKWREYR
ncbi:MAG: transcription factor S [Thermoplasmatota archaeon]